MSSSTSPPLALSTSIEMDADPETQSLVPVDRNSVGLLQMDPQTITTNGTSAESNTFQDEAVSPLSNSNSDSSSNPSLMESLIVESDALKACLPPVISSLAEQTPLVLHVQTLTGEAISIDIQPSVTPSRQPSKMPCTSPLEQWTVGMLKQRIQDMRGIPARVQILMYRDRVLEPDAANLAAFQLRHGSRLSLSIPVAGGHQQPRISTRSPSTLLFLCFCQGDMFLVELKMKPGFQRSSLGPNMVGDTKNGNNTNVTESNFEGVLNVETLTADALLTELYEQATVPLTEIESLGVDAIVASSTNSQMSSRVSSAGISSASTVSETSLPSLFKHACFQSPPDDVEQDCRSPSFCLFNDAPTVSELQECESENEAWRMEKLSVKERTCTASARCFKCHKKLRFGGSVFKCRCGHVYCSTHRYSDRHECRFDYKADVLKQ